MSDRINHVAVFVAAIAYFMFGYLWYGLLFASLWTSLMQKSAANMQAGPQQYVISFVLGLILSYSAAIALSRRPEDQTVSQGVSFALFMSIAIYATQTLNNALFASQPLGLWLINAGYVVIGFAIIGAIVGGWKKSAAA
jgi:glucan phosphoethanolaminetransferase (alkaline phosphatase superfamily)